MATAQIKKLPVEHDVEDDDSLYPSRMPTSVRRYKPTQSLPTASSSTRSSQRISSKSSSSSSKNQKMMSEPDTNGDTDIDDEQEPVTQAPPSVLRRRASLESEQPRATASMQAVRAPTGNLHINEPANGTREASTPSATRGSTAPLKHVDLNAKASSEKASTTNIPSAALTGRLPHTDALPRLGRMPLVAILIGMVGAILLVMVLGAFSSWWHVYQDDIHYGRPRTYQLDAVVGHGDSAAHPTHFIFLNLHRHVEIIEISGGDPAHTHIYVGPVLFGDGQDLTPVTGEIRDVNGDGKPDMIVHIQNQEIIYLNNGTIFVPQATNQ